MFFSKVVMVAVLLACFIMTGCGDDKTQQIENVFAQLKVVEVECDSLRQVAQSRNLTILSLEAEHQRLEDSTAVLSARIQDVEQRVSQAEAQLNDERGKFEASLDVVEAWWRESDSTLTETQHELQQMQEAQLNAADRYQVYLGDMQEWNDKLVEHDLWDVYWRYEGTRNWLKKLFGADRRERPAGVEYGLPAPPIFDSP